MMQRHPKKYVINSVVRAARILESFTLEEPELTNAQLAKKNDFPRGTVTRLLCSLEEAGFVRRSNQAGKYLITYKLHQIGQVPLHHDNIYRESLPILSELVAKFNETAHLGILDNDEVLYTEQVQCNQPVALISAVGRRLPVHSTAIGKVLIAELDKDAIDTIIKKKKLVLRTQRTIVNHRILLNQLRKIRKDGYALTKGEYQSDVVSVAAPIRDRHSRIAAAISMAGPSYRMDRPELIEKIILAVKEAADRVSKRLGFVGGNKNNS